MKDKVLVDTSVWIDYFRSPDDSPLAERVNDCISSSTIIVPKVVLAELIQGAHSVKELSALGEFVEAFTVIGESETTWQAAGKLSYDLKKKGKTVNLTDCYIAVIALENDCGILTLDKHFKDIQKISAIRLM